MPLPQPTQPLPSEPTVHPVTSYLASLAPTSRRATASSLRTLAQLVSADADPMSVPWHELRFSHTQAVRARLVERYAPTTARRHLSTLRSVLREALRLGLMAPDAYQNAVDLKPVRGTRLPAGREVSREELAKLFSVCAGDSAASGRRDSAVLALLFGAGLRRAEAVALDLRHLHGGETLRVVGKGDKERLVPLPPGTQMAVECWLNVRGRAEGPLLTPVGRGGRVVNRRLTTQALWKRLRFRVSQAGITHLTPHDLRRTYVSSLLDAGADLSVVQRLVGHASPTTTARYDRRGNAAMTRAANLLDVPVPA